MKEALPLLFIDDREVVYVRIVSELSLRWHSTWRWEVNNCEVESKFSHQKLFEDFEFFLLKL